MAANPTSSPPPDDPSPATGAPGAADPGGPVASGPPGEAAPLTAPLTPPPTPARTPLQVEASRRNGAKSRGPKTTAGKKRSRANALTHGILAKSIAPAASAHHEHRDFQRLREGLIRQYRPALATEWCAIEVLSGLYVQLGRLARLRELVMNVGTPRTPFPGAHPHDAAAYVRILARWIAATEDAAAPRKRLKLARAESLGRDLAAIALEMEAAAEEMRKPTATTQERTRRLMDVDFHRAFQATCRACRDIEPKKCGFTSALFLTEVFRRTRKVPDAQQAKWRLFLEWARQRFEQHILEFEAQARASRAAEATGLTTLFSEENVVRLDLLQRYETACMRAIERQIGLLEGWRVGRAQRRADRRRTAPPTLTADPPPPCGDP